MALLFVSWNLYFVLCNQALSMFIINPQDRVKIITTLACLQEEKKYSKIEF